jgi:hypothetical protein
MRRGGFVYLKQQGARCRSSPTTGIHRCGGYVGFVPTSTERKKKPPEGPLIPSLFVYHPISPNFRDIAILARDMVG